MQEQADPNFDREREIFLNALEWSSAAERAAFLDGACGGDAALRARIDELLRNHTADSFLEAPPLDSAPTQIAAASIQERPGAVIGRYKLLQQIGEGGFGVVYMAEQKEPVKRRVALKIIKLGMDTKQVVARFEAERQALAMMDHPNIAKVLDGGATESGRPYFVMELVKGLPITKFCDENNLSTKERLELFATVCHAIQHAHQKGIIHRDVKPSNVLVTLHDGKPVPKVIDFGIAKATQQELTEKTIFTQFQQMIGTPAYMSPEQAEMSGLDIDTRSDIYSLGVLLYELLTGKTPLDAKILLSRGYDEIRRRIKEEEPLRPSTRVSTMEGEELTSRAKHRNLDPRRFAAELRGDLDWIVMKALEKDRTRRYETASSLANDIQRHLNNEAVLARPPSGAYRFQKLVQRNKLVFTAATAVAAALVIGLGAATVMFFRERLARKGEQQQRLTAQSAQKVAMKKSREAALARERAEETARKLSLDNYTADMKVVQAAIGEDNRGRAVELLQKYLLKQGEEDLRGLEWRYLWRQAQGDETYTFRGFGGPVDDAIFSPNDGGLLATIDHDYLDEVGTVKVWEMASKRPVFNFAGKVGEVQGSGSLIAFSPDGKNLAAILGNAITIWETNRWQVLTNLEGALQSLVYSPDGKILAACVDGGVRLWDTATWRTNFLPTGLKPEKWAFAAISADSRLLATAESTQPIQVWDLASLSKIVDLKSPSGWIVSVAFSTKENLLAAADWEGVLRIWDLATREQVVTNFTQASFISGMSFSPDGKTLALAGADQTIRLLDVATQRPLATLRGHLKEVWKVVYSPDGQFLASASKDGTAKLWNAVRGPEADDFWSEPSGAAFMGIERGAGLLMYSSTNQPVEFWKVADGKAAKSFSLNIEPEDRWHVRCSPDGRLAAIGKTNGVVELYDCASARLLKPLKVGEDLFVPLAISADKRLVVLNRDKDSRLGVWDIEAGTQIFTVQAYNSYGDISAIFSPNGRLLAYKGPQFSVQLREIATSRELTLKGHTWAVNTLNFSQDGKLLVSTGVDDEARIWDVTTGRQFAPTPLKGHTQGLRFAQFTADSRTVLTTDQRTVRFWNVLNGQEMVSINDAGNFMLAADGNTLVLQTIDRKRRFMRIPTLAEIDAVETANAK